MEYRTIVRAEEVAMNLDNSDWVVIDCRFSLKDKEKGLRDYLYEHIFGAFFADLEKDLSGEIIPDKTGRHPLPEVSDFIEVISKWGVTNQSQVVVYDDVGGAIAARLWWMFRWIGHEKVALLDGGWKAWIQATFPTKNGYEYPREGNFESQMNESELTSISTVDQWRQSPRFHVVDTREPERYRGEIEPIDRIAGRIPGAISFPYKHNLDSEGFFKSSEELRSAYSDLLGDIPPENVICYCGSGVTAALNLVGLVHAGLEGGRLYVGSWSDWITDPDRPISTG